MRTLLLLGAVLVVATFVVVLSSFHPIVFSEGASISELRTEITSMIRTQGASKTYAAFKQYQSSKEFDGSHAALHLFGETLYNVEGEKSITVCDEQFNYGCFHGFVSAAIAADGLAAATPLDASCATLGDRGSTVCQHGIGHGIIEYLGHEHLREALEACKLTHQPDPLAGCTGGVFMEYNVPLTIGDDGRYQVAPRTLLDRANPYAPCDTLSGTTFEQSCYLELPQWWHQVYPDDYVRFGNFCDALSNPANKEACVNGIGKIIPSVAAYDVDAARALCAKVGEGATYMTCIVQASWSFKSNTGNTHAAIELCAPLPAHERYRCPS